MYSWIGSKPYAQRKTWRALFKRVDGERGYRAFNTEAEAEAFIAGAQPHLVKDGRPIEGVIDAYVASQTLLRASSRSTLRYRLRAICKGRERMPIEVFPWVQAPCDRVVAARS